MAQRISRAKQRIKAAGVPFRLPPEPERAERLRVVLHVLYLIFNEGYTATSGPDLQRADLTGEAIRLTRDVHRLLPDDGEVAGLLALMLLTDARRAARTGPTAPWSRWPNRTATGGTGTHRRGRRADHRTRWPGRRSARTSSRRRSPRCTTRRRAPEDTDWPQILALYELLDAHRAQPDGHAQPGRRGRDGATAREAGLELLGRWTPTTGWPATTGSTRSARTCWRWPATTTAARAAYRRRRAAPPACPNSATSRAGPPGWQRKVLDVLSRPKAGSRPAFGR